MTRRGPPEEGDDGVLYEGDFLLTADEQRALAPFIQRALTEVRVNGVCLMYIHKDLCRSK